MSPANHFTGQCSACHNIAGWRGARFDHQGARDWPVWLEAGV